MNLLTQNSNFINSLKYCKRLITLSTRLKKYLNNLYPTVQIDVIKHPIKTIKNKFCLNNFFKFKNKLIVHLGFQSRKISTIFRIKSYYKKLLLLGRKNMTPQSILKRINQELDYLNDTKTEVLLKDINLFYFESFEEFDDLLRQSIVVIPLWDASANNSILEVIELNIPAFVTRTEATEEYLFI